MKSNRTMSFGLALVCALAACPEPTATTGKDSGTGRCTNECNSGDQLVCAGGVKNCSDVDNDGCLEWTECVATCSNKCSTAGEKRCQNNAVQVCNDTNSDGCLEWSDPTSCGTGQTCQNGECTCTADCTTAGQKRCVGENFQECGNFDSDSCLEWSAEKACPTGQTCSNNQCSAAATCTDDCPTAGAKQCSGERGYQTCGNYDADTCRDWSGVTNCAQFEKCQGGACVPNCSNECPTNGEKVCQGNGVKTCGNSDTDPCLEWSAVTDCKAGESCSGGVCAPATSCTDDCAANQKECLTDYPVASKRVCGEADDGDTCRDWVISLCVPVLDMCLDGECVTHCDNECDAIDAKTCTPNNAYQVCGNHDSDACLEWNTPVSCGTQFCVNGVCGSACSNDCSTAGTRVCSSDNSGYRTCGNYDADGCLDLSDVTRCGTGETCVSGVCQAACSDDCIWGDYGCSTDLRSEWWCDDSDGDGCLEEVTYSCASDETCRDGWCQATTTSCTDDTKEQNDSQSAAVWISEGPTGGLQICPADEDWYYTYLYSGETLTVDVLFTHASGDLDLKIYDAAGAVVGRSTGVTDNEQASATATSAGSYYIQVYGYGNAANAYAVDVTITTGSSCADDSYEPNNSRTAAAYVDSGYVGSLQLCGGDQDWYEVYLLQYESLRAVINFTHSSGDLDLKLVDSSGATLDSSVSVSNSETVELTPVATGGSYYLEVYGANASAQNAYTLDVATVYTPPCIDDTFEDNDTFAVAVTPSSVDVGYNDYPGLQICKGDDDWYRVYMYTGENLDVSVDFTHSAGDLDLYLYNASEQQIDSSVSSANTESVSTTMNGNGYIYFKVIGYNQAQNSYDLTIYIH